MPVPLYILIAERNPHVREFLRRELDDETTPAEVAEDGREVLRRLATLPEIDLLILDPDLPFLDELALFRRLRSRMPRPVVILHAFGADRDDWAEFWRSLPLVEKGGRSTEQLRKRIAGLRAQRGG